MPIKASKTKDNHLWMKRLLNLTKNSITHRRTTLFCKKSSRELILLMIKYQHGLREYSANSDS